MESPGCSCAFILIRVTMIIKAKEAVNLRETRKRGKNELGKGWWEEGDVQNDVNIEHICKILK